MPSAALNVTTNGDNTIVTPPAGYCVRVQSFLLTFSAAVNAKFIDGGSGAMLCGLLYGLGAAPTAISSPVANEVTRGIFQTSKDKALVLNLSAGVPVGGVVVFENVSQ